MAKAEVTLVGSLSLMENGRTFHRGKTQLLTDPAEIASYENRPGFQTKMIESLPSKKVVTKATAKKTAKKPEQKPEQSLPAPEPKPGIPTYTKGKLSQMRKSELIELGMQHDLGFDGLETAKQMIADILLAQEGQEE